MSIRKKDDYNGYMREYVLNRYYKRREKALKMLGGCCVVCGASENLEIDHIDHNAKEFSIAKALAGFSEVRLNAELAKCQLLCNAHHEEKSIYESGKSPAVHGTITMYASHNCRCDMCKKANANYSKLRRTQ